MSQRRSYLVLNALGLIAIAAIAGHLAQAGPLDPPAGPVTPTYKTLTEVEPRIAINAVNTPGDADSMFKITQPGSYYLAGNITGVVGKHGIEIASVGVTVDLNGFALVGVPEMGSFDGVSAFNGLSDIAVVNGSVIFWGDGGVDLGTNSLNCRVEGVRAFGSHRNGITVGISCTVANCSALLTSGNGISTGDGGTVTNCSVNGAFANGILTGNGSTTSNCTAYDNNNDNGILTGNGSTVSNCTAYDNNFANGITTGSGCTVSNCTADDNEEKGITTGSGCTVLGCSASGNLGNGISASDNCTVVNCSASGNTGHGISTFNGCTITNCTANNNLARGININNGGQVTGCLTRTNQSDGIAVNFACTVSGNACNGDGLAAGNQGGIRVLGQANRVESNNVTFADRGLLVDAGGNVIVRNTVSGCTVNWVVAANNVCGPILDRTAPASAAINGNSAPDSTGSTHPNANFTY